MKICIQKIIKNNNTEEDAEKDAWRPAEGERKTKQIPKHFFGK